MQHGIYNMAYSPVPTQDIDDDKEGLENSEIVRTIVKNQDNVLDDLDISLMRISTMSLEISKEIEESNKSIETIDNDIESRLERSISRENIDELERQECYNIWGYFILGILLAILIVLVKKLLVK